MCIDNNRLEQYASPDGWPITNAKIPGPLDQGTPLIMQENGRSAIIAMFLRRLPKVGLAAQVSPETVNWIYENADWTQESTESNKCTTFTSCACGTANVQKRRRRHKRQNSIKASHRMYHGEMVYAHDKYPWQVLIFNRLNDQEFNFYVRDPPDGTNFDLCSGSLITNR